MEQLTASSLLYVPNETGLNLFLHPYRVARNYFVYNPQTHTTTSHKTNNLALQILAGIVAFTVWLIPTLIGLAYQRFSNIHQENYKKAIASLQDIPEQKKEMPVPSSTYSIPTISTGLTEQVAKSSIAPSQVAISYINEADKKWLEDNIAYIKKYKFTFSYAQEEQRIAEVCKSVDTVLASLKFQHSLPYLHSLSEVKLNQSTFFIPGYQLDKTVSSSNVKTYIGECYKTYGQEEYLKKIKELHNLFQRCSFCQDQHEFLLEAAASHIETNQTAIEKILDEVCNHDNFKEIFIQALSEAQIRELGALLRSRTYAEPQNNDLLRLAIDSLESFKQHIVEHTKSFDKDTSILKSKIAKVKAFLEGLQKDPLNLLQELQPFESIILVLVVVDNLLTKIKKAQINVDSLREKKVKKLLSEIEKQTLDDINFFGELLISSSERKELQLYYPFLSSALVMLHPNSDDIKIIFETLAPICSRQFIHHSNYVFSNTLRAIIKTENFPAIYATFKSFWSLNNPFHYSIWSYEVKDKEGRPNEIRKIALLTIPQTLPEERALAIKKNSGASNSVITTSLSLLRRLTESADSKEKRMLSDVDTDRMKEVWDSLFISLPRIDAELEEATGLPRDLVQQIISQYLYAWRSSCDEERALFEKLLEEEQKKAKQLTHVD